MRCCFLKYCVVYVYMEEPIRLGYACLNTALREDDIFSSRGIILKNANLKGVGELHRLVLANIEDTATILKWNESNGIRNFRLTSGLLPHYTNPRLEYRYTMDFAEKPLADLGAYARRHGHRLTTHPDHFSYMIASPMPTICEHSVNDLKMHDELLTRIGCGPDGTLCIHLGGTYGDKASTLERWVTAYRNLPAGVQQRIVLENDEWNWGVNDVLPLCERMHIPFVLDWFHNSVSGDRVNLDDKTLDRVLKTWQRAGVRPLMHYSEQSPGKRKGSHSDLVESLPADLLSIPRKFGVGVDVDLECKLKEQSVIRMYEKYFDRTTADNRVIWRLR